MKYFAGGLVIIAGIVIPAMLTYSLQLGVVPGFLLGVVCGGLGGWYGMGLILSD